MASSTPAYVGSDKMLILYSSENKKNLETESDPGWVLSRIKKKRKEKKQKSYLSFVERILWIQMFAIKQFKENTLVFLCKHSPAASEILTQQHCTETLQKRKYSLK